MNTVKQIDIWLKNEPGSLSNVSDVLGKNGINIIAFCVTTEGDEGKLHFVASDPEKAANVLKASGYTMDVKDVIACEVPHHPGGLNTVLKVLKNVNINVDNIYPCIGTGDITILIVSVGPAEEAMKVLSENWVRIFDESIYYM